MGWHDCWDNNLTSRPTYIQFATVHTRPHLDKEGWEVFLGKPNNFENRSVRQSAVQTPVLVKLISGMDP